MSRPNEKAFVGVLEMSEVSGLSDQFLKRMAAEGKVPTFRVGKRLMFDRVGTIEALRRMAL